MHRPDADNIVTLAAPPDTFALRCRVNDEPVERDVAVDRSLLAFLRDDLGLTGTKGACLEGECGSCTVIADGVPIDSCMTLACQMNGRKVTTIEGLARGDRLAVLQQCFIDSGAAQCGYCTPGLIMAAEARLRADPGATENDIVECIEANICRCTGYASILSAIRAAAKELCATETGA